MGDKICISKVFSFSCAHVLGNNGLSASDNEKIFGVCSKLHGHNYKLEVTVSGEVDDKTGMVINFTDLKKIVTDLVIKKFDHRLLNEIPELKNKVTTAENIVLVIKKILLKQGLSIKRLKLWETDSSFVEIEL